MYMYVYISIKCEKDRIKNRSIHNMNFSSLNSVKNL